MAFSKPRQDGDTNINIDIHNSGTPVRYASLDRVYSACVTGGSSNVMSKKVKARKLLANHLDDPDHKPSLSNKPPIIHVYSRSFKRPRHSSFFDSLLAAYEQVDDDSRVSKKRTRVGSSELVKLGVDSTVLRSFDGPRLRGCRNTKINNTAISKTKKPPVRKRISHPVSSTTKRWLRLSFDGVDSRTFIGLQCKVYWPLDGDWYSGHVVGYDLESNRHQVKYQDGDKEDLFLSNEDVKFYMSQDDMDRLKLSPSVNNMDNNGYDFNELVVLAASLDNCQEIEAGDIIWAKLTGHAMWPAVVVDESLIGDRKGLNRTLGGKSVTVQFFGTHDFARINVKQVISFLKGLVSSYHRKCKKPRFTRSLEEAKVYLSGQKLPQRMIQLRNGIGVDIENACRENEGSSASDEVCMKDKRIHGTPGSLGASPFVVGDLQILSLGKIVKDSEYFQDDRSIWPEGYTAIRKFTSIKEPNGYSSYKMEVLRDAESKIRPLFRVTLDNTDQFLIRKMIMLSSAPKSEIVFMRVVSVLDQEEMKGILERNSFYLNTQLLKAQLGAGCLQAQLLHLKDGQFFNIIYMYATVFEGSTPSACWNKIFKKIRKRHHNSSDGFSAEGGLERSYGSGSDMFGFSNPEVMKLLQGLSKSRLASKYSMGKLTSGRYRDLPAGYRPVRVDWKDLDKCSVCHMDEVHARCYGELEPVDGVLWLCNLCCPGAPESPPPCCLCPVIGGAMKPTTDGRWAHLACAMWIPGSIVGSCYVAFVVYLMELASSVQTVLVELHIIHFVHVLLIFVLRYISLLFVLKLEDEDRLHLLSLDEDDEDQCIRLLSFCKKHRQPSNERLATDERIGPNTHRCCDYSPPYNPSGCARTEPYNHLGRRGRKEPEALAAASLKRLFVENQPYLVAGYCQHGLSGNTLPSIGLTGSKFSISIHKDALNNILSMADKYKYMRETFRKRLAFGKSGIHGFGIFAKHPHRAGDMVIEYTGELVRPPIADRRERFIYNSLVGAGTYMFRIDDERVIDATRAGSIAHLINHSCEPNCYSRVISVSGDEHIIIFAKRDIKQWEELTYDYRFFSIDEQLACYCGFTRCRGIVNDTEAEEQAAKLYAPRSELIDWKGE
ncbi:hypothetical protein EZV62_001495 [Acer yangbiense]|uniref:Histone-lysine N-methyltransferase n=1 Tax=Acer yangbiense TaxID=1000413 RepID=A0A5C7IWN3_9ROSI|nr:hypothetical protein EZV62_001495 [Acer yangbiense]